MYLKYYKTSHYWRY